ncbi:hypothetical protein SAMN02745729_101306 [Marinobacterium iners DSM 11526]|uniref:Uncharacterized protein n=1 Tax=Marinobacterium iners DSM 11526 TaxID=1122198 RepID=A0A1H3Y099_9GAMM|nr:hypothetical protein SAMN02745729_101306 [Marinobacterium iners DSM 11526]
MKTLVYHLHIPLLGALLLALMLAPSVKAETLQHVVNVDTSPAEISTVAR